MGIVLKQSFKNTIFIYLGFLIGGINTLYLYTRILQDDYHGLVTFLLATSNLIMPLMAFGINHTVVTFFFQITSKNKFIGIFLTLLFFIGNIASKYFGFNHSLYKYGGKTLGIYSEMKGYGHFLKPYLWIITENTMLK